MAKTDDSTTTPGAPGLATTDSLRIPVLVALAAMPIDVFGHVIERLSGLDAHLNDVVRGLELPSAEAAKTLDTAIQDYLTAHTDRVAAATADAAAVAAAPPAAAPTPAPKAKKKPAKKAAATKKASSAKKRGAARK